MEQNNGKDGRRTKSDSRNSSEMFASCSFSSLGLHPTLCEQLKGNLLILFLFFFYFNYYLAKSCARIVIFFVGNLLRNREVGFRGADTGAGAGHSRRPVRPSRVVFSPICSESSIFGVEICIVVEVFDNYGWNGKTRLVNAATGSGKTVAYLAPIIHLLQKYDQRIHRSDGTFALVLVPTRELCMQVYEILQRLLHRFHWIVPGYIMGGESRSKEKARLRKGVSILIATPGRLLDHLKNTSSFQHSKLRWIIFDEADRILELGYGKEIEDILNCLGSRQCEKFALENSALTCEVQMQNLLLSATLNEKVNHLAKISLENPVMIGLDDKKISENQDYDQISLESDVVDGVEESEKMASFSTEEYKIPAQLVQSFVKVPCGSRLAVLLSILKHLIEREACRKVVVFFSTCDAVDFHHYMLNELQWASTSQPDSNKQIFLRCNTLRLHGKMNQDDRKKAFQSFKTEQSALLLSTDVSARGLDFPKVKFIIQYDSPGEATEYVHRVGRTARLGEKGDSLLFLQPSEMDYLKDLEKHKVLLAEYPLLKILNSFPLYNRTDRSSKFASIEMHPWLLTLQRGLESFISAEPRMKKLAKDAFCSWVRAYTAHRGELKQIFMVKKLHLGHVARSFALKEQPSLVNKSIQKQIKKRKRNDIHQKVKSKKRTL